VIEENDVFGMLRTLVTLYCFSDIQLIYRTVDAVIDLMAYEGKVKITNETIVWLVGGL
jgi:hypothetical protein